MQIKFVIDTYKGEFSLDQINRIEERLLDRDFRSLPGPRKLSGGGFLGWYAEKMHYSLGEESVVIYRIKNAIYGHPIGDFWCGDVKIKVEKKTYDEIFLGCST